MLAQEAVGQGQVTFYAGAGKIAYCLWGGEITGWPVGDPSTVPGWGKLNIAFYSALPGTPLKMSPWGNVPDLSYASGWKLMQSPPIRKIVGLPGLVIGVICQLDPSTLVYDETDCILVAWSGDYPSFQAAVESWTYPPSMVAWTGACGSGGNLGWRQKTGTSLVPVMIAPGAFDRLMLGAMEWSGDYPTHVWAQAGYRCVYLNWQNTWEPLTFEIKRSANGGSFEVIATTTGTNYIDTAVTEGVSYRYAVVTCSFTYGNHIVTATPFGPPTLGAAIGDGSASCRLAWPEWAPEFRAYSTTNLEPGSTWLPVTNAVFSSNGLFHVLVSTTNRPAEFFQLRSP